MRHFSVLKDLHDYMGWSAPLHPMFSVITYAEDGVHPASCRRTSPPCTSEFYMVAIKRLVRGEVFYGRTRYDFSHGVMKFVAPGQVLEWLDVELEPWGYTLVMHQDYVRGREIETRLKKYGFFSYAANEALHLSPREEQVAISHLRTMEAEYAANPDEFSKDIILSQLDTLLRYSDRFYRRQFRDRATMNSDLGDRFRSLMIGYFESGRFEEQGSPSIDWIAGELSMSPRYLSDTLKAGTGKTAKEHIHLFLVDAAKSLLLAPGVSVSEAAYRLGFEYPQYFSRLFRKRTGMSPREYQTAGRVRQ